MNFAFFDPLINRSRTDIHERRSFIRRQHLHLSHTFAAPTLNGPLPASDDQSPVRFDNDFSSPNHYVRRILLETALVLLACLPPLPSGPERSEPHCCLHPAASDVWHRDR